MTAAIVAVFTIIIGPALLRMRPDQDDYLLAFIANGEAANRIEETSPRIGAERSS